MKSNRVLLLVVFVAAERFEEVEVEKPCAVELLPVVGSGTMEPSGTW